MNFHEIKKAFTLAEVLVTLTIIGVIAAISIPTLLQSTNNAEAKTQWKQNYAIMSQAINKMIMDTADDFVEYRENTSSFEPLLRTYFNYVKDDPAMGLYHRDLLAATYKDLSGAPMRGELMDDGQIILSNGALIMIENYSVNGAPLIIWVDINGFEKGPNILGKDLFGGEVVDDKRLVPIGNNTVTQIDCDCSKTPCQITKWAGYGSFNLAGAGCSADYLSK